jgi:hypothetical protein
MRSLLVSITAFCAISGYTPVWALMDDVMPAQLADAVARRHVEAGARENWRFTLTVESEVGTIIGRYDGSLLADQQWMLLSPMRADMTEEQMDIWIDTIEPDEGETADGGLFFSDEEAEIFGGDYVVLPAATNRISYGFTPNLGDEDGARMEGHINGEVTIVQDTGVIESVRVFAPESFKPHPIARLHTFELRFGFELLDGQSVPHMTSFSTQLSGNAAFQDFSQDLTLRFSDVEYIGQ